MPSRRELANAIRALSMDAVQRAKSGHPGAPMGMADIAEVLWNDFLRHNPANPHWVNRDRFVLSNGHGSMLIYSLLHLSGYDLPLDELRNFRQLHSKTPGHPEFGYTPGVETTTGPLGQGLANAVGMALAEKVLAAQFNRPGHPLVDHYTYCFAGDGCLMEGVSHEACSLAGTLGLGKLVVFYDDNGISIDGKVEGWFTDDTPRRFRAYGWHVIEDVDGHDAEAVKRATEEARRVTDRPTLICCKTVIGFGAPNACGTHGVHGAPLGDDEIQATREFLNWEHAPFEIPPAIYDGYDAREAGARAEASWNETLAAYRKAHPELAAEFERRMAGALPKHLAGHADDLLARVADQAEKVATRKASQNALEGFGPYLPELIGGSADLTGSNNTKWSGCAAVTAEDGDGNYVYYGVREFAMTAIQNGLALHGGFLPYGGTFLVFSDYARNAVRMAALMKLRSIMVYTHDSIGLGEDGPTHQPVEHLASLRLIPGLHVWRPCDSVETVAAWRSAIERGDGPTCLVLTRQGLPCQERSPAQLDAIRRGGYVLRDCDGEPELLLLATGSEVALAAGAWERLMEQGVRVRLVSLPCVEVFLAQDQAYRDSVIPPGLRRRLAVEAGHVDYWYRFVGLDGAVIGMDRFGESAPADALFAYFGFTVDNVVNTALGLLGE
ncbi:MAG: transketolase [Ectothiorhodospiraceae bacterium]|nr:transketolase [Ectothiorhodospiraceae bacterium]